MTPTPQRRPGRDHITACAVACFARTGVAETSLQAIADEAGVTKAAVYHHFRSKAAIVDAVTEPVMVDLEGALARAEALGDAAQQVSALVGDLARQAVDNHDIYAIVLADVATARLTRDSPRASAVFATLERALAGPDADAARHLRVSMFLSGLIGPAIDPRLRELDEQLVRREIVALGEALLRE
ncbi:MAG: TetR/AcrR family transcriptional regulator [Demequina sp.]